VFYNRVLNSPAIMKYCFHGGRVMQWMPYQGWDDLDGTVNVTYYGSNNQLAMHQAWRKNNPKSNERPFCVIARMGGRDFLLTFLLEYLLFRVRGKSELG
jgi:hypothetical protein